MENFLAWWIGHNPQIIQWLLASIVFVSAVVVGVSLFRKKSPTLDNSDQFEETLKRILEQTRSAAIPSSSASFSADPKAVASGNVSGDAASSNVISISAADPDLVKKLTETQTKIESLNKQINELESQKGKSKEFEEKIKELEGKLQEYEIIEDDIADLNKYKEENAKLKEQLGQGGVAAPDLVGAFEQKVSENQILDEQMKIQKPAQPLPEDEPVVSAAPNPASATAVEPTVAEKPPQEAADDLFAEFARETESLSDETSIDTEKMLSEVATLDTAASADSALEEVTDFDKMSQEADQLDSKN